MEPPSDRDDGAASPVGGTTDHEREVKLGLSLVRVDSRADDPFRTKETLPLYDRTMVGRSSVAPDNSVSRNALQFLLQEEDVETGERVIVAKNVGRTSVYHGRSAHSSSTGALVATDGLMIKRQLSVPLEFTKHNSGDTFEVQPGDVIKFLPERFIYKLVSTAGTRQAQAPAVIPPPSQKQAAAPKGKQKQQSPVSSGDVFTATAAKEGEDAETVEKTKSQAEQKATPERRASPLYREPRDAASLLAAQKKAKPPHAGTASKEEERTKPKPKAKTGGSTSSVSSAGNTSMSALTGGATTALSSRDKVKGAKSTLTAPVGFATTTTTALLPGSDASTSSHTDSSSASSERSTTSKRKLLTMRLPAGRALSDCRIVICPINIFSETLKIQTQGFAKLGALVTTKPMFAPSAAVAMEVKEEDGGSNNEEEGTNEGDRAAGTSAGMTTGGSKGTAGMKNKQAAAAPATGGGGGLTKADIARLIQDPTRLLIFIVDDSVTIEELEQWWGKPLPFATNAPAPPPGGLMAAAAADSEDDEDEGRKPKGGHDKSTLFLLSFAATLVGGLGDEDRQRAKERGFAEFHSQHFAEALSKRKRLDPTTYLWRGKSTLYEQRVQAAAAERRRQQMLAGGGVDEGGLPLASASDDEEGEGGHASADGGSSNRGRGKGRWKKTKIRDKNALGMIGRYGRGVINEEELSPNARWELRMDEMVKQAEEQGTTPGGLYQKQGKRQQMMDLDEDEAAGEETATTNEDDNPFAQAVLQGGPTVDVIGQAFAPMPRRGRPVGHASGLFPTAKKAVAKPAVDAEGASTKPKLKSANQGLGVFAGMDRTGEVAASIATPGSTLVSGFKRKREELEDKAIATSLISNVDPKQQLALLSSAPWWLHLYAQCDEASLWGIDPLTDAPLPCPFPMHVLERVKQRLQQRSPWLDPDTTSGKKWLLPAPPGSSSVSSSSAAPSPPILYRLPHNSYGRPFGINLNRHITSKLSELMELYHILPEMEAGGRMTVLETAIGALTHARFKVRNREDAERLGNIGEKTLDKIDSILQTGTLEVLQKAIQNQRIKTIKAFCNVLWIGPWTAAKLYERGYHSLDDLRRSPKEAGLSHQQRLGIDARYYDDLQQRISREEGAAMERYVQSVVNRILPGTLCVLGGSYRRGQPSSSDYDFILSPPPPFTTSDLLPALWRQLSRDKVIVEDLSSSWHKQSPTAEDPDLVAPVDDPSVGWDPAKMPEIAIRAMEQQGYGEFIPSAMITLAKKMRKREEKTKQAKRGKDEEPPMSAAPPPAKKARREGDDSNDALLGKVLASRGEVDEDDKGDPNGINPGRAIRKLAGRGPYYGCLEKMLARLELEDNSDSSEEEEERKHSHVTPTKGGGFRPPGLFGSGPLSKDVERHSLNTYFGICTSAPGYRPSSSPSSSSSSSSSDSSAGKATYYRRIDLKCFHYSMMPMALIQWTGNTPLNKSLRLFANYLPASFGASSSSSSSSSSLAASASGAGFSEKGMGPKGSGGYELDETSLVPQDSKRTLGNPGPLFGAARVKARSEVDVFSWLGLAYIRPWERACYGSHKEAGGVAVTSANISSATSIPANAGHLQPLTPHDEQDRRAEEAVIAVMLANTKEGKEKGRT
jgi:Fingers domain of DNA polymerase lambda/DNA polymerase beta palm/DNA polymerase beta thumb